MCLLCPDNPLMNASRHAVELVGDELEQAEPAELLTLRKELPELLLEELPDLAEALPELLEELLELLEELPELLEEPPELLEELPAVRPVGAVGDMVSPLVARNAAICITHQLEGLCAQLAL